MRVTTIPKSTPHTYKTIGLLHPEKPKIVNYKWKLKFHNPKCPLFLIENKQIIQLMHKFHVQQNSGNVITFSLIGKGKHYKTINFSIGK